MAWLKAHRQTWEKMAKRAQQKAQMKVFVTQLHAKDKAEQTAETHSVQGKQRMEEAQ